jgi:outer membrane protein W
MVNLVTLFGRKYYYPLNVYLIGGIGLNYAWSNNDAFARKELLLLAYDNKRFSHNARVGAMLDFNVSKHVSINLEVSANNLNDRYNSRKSNKGDWQITTQLGVAYKFAGKKAKKAVELE